MKVHKAILIKLKQVLYLYGSPLLSNERMNLSIWVCVLFAGKKYFESSPQTLPVYGSHRPPDFAAKLCSVDKKVEVLKKFNSLVTAHLTKIGFEKLGRTG